MGTLVSFRLPRELLDALKKLAKEESKDRTEIVRELLSLGIKEKKLQRAIQRYKDGRITLWKAAREADISLWEMIEVARERKIEAQYGIKELEEDLKALRD